jgi:ABC-type uncharacterized transport system permease subunit
MKSPGMVFLVLAGVLIVTASALDWTFRERMASIGYRKAFLLGGALDYAEYHKSRQRHGWPAWPVYVMWALYICGIGLLIAGFFVHFGTQPHHNS